MSSNVLQPNQTKPTSKTNFLFFCFFFWGSLYVNEGILKMGGYLNCPSATPKKSPSSSLSLKKKNIFHRVMWAFLGFSLAWSELPQRKQENQEPSHPFPFSLFTSLSFSFSFFFLSLSFALFTHFHYFFPHPPLSLSLSLSFFPIYLFSLSLSSFSFSIFLSLYWLLGYCSFFFSSMKKMKGGVFQYPVFEKPNPKTMFKHQSLLQDYHELEKETEASKKKLQMMKQKKMTLLAEVRFLRKRYEFLMKNQSSNDRSNGDLFQQKKISNQVASKKKGKNGVKKRPALLALSTISDVNQKERIYRGIDVSLQNSTPNPILDLNQKAKTSRKKANLQNSTQNLDLNQKERLCSRKDAGERNVTPFFDLNQISTEEEEMQAFCEPLRVAELKKSLLRSGNDEQHNDIKISACRTVGDGPSRAGKRKISWQDQVALRV